MKVQKIITKIFTTSILAYSLLEVAISIGIAGIAISMVTPIWHTISVAKKIRINEQKYHYIRNAMQAYVIRYGHLPHAAENLNGVANMQHVKGYLPYKTLGISKQYALDSNNKPFTYAINKHLGKHATKEHIPLMRNISTNTQRNQISFCRLFKYKDSGALAIIDEICVLDNLIVLEKGISIVDEQDHFFVMKPMSFFHTIEKWKEWQATSITQKTERMKNCNAIAWVLIAHGSNKKNKPLSNCAQMNKTETQKFCILPADDDNGFFNDTVFYQTRFDLAAQAGFPCTAEPMLYSNVAGEAN